MATRRKSRPEHDALVRDPAADPEDLASAIFCLGLDHRYEFEEDFERFLDHEDYMVRGQAMHVLLGWGRENQLHAGLHAVRHEPYFEARSRQILGLTEYAQLRPEARDVISRTLVQVIRERKGRTRSDAYEAILRIHGEPIDPRFYDGSFDPERDIDWDLLEPYTEPPPGPH